MSNAYETDGRGPTERQLLFAGIGVILVAALITAFPMLKSTGRLTSRSGGRRTDQRRRRPAPELRREVPRPAGRHGPRRLPGTDGRPNTVAINLKPEFAKSIPATVTARVVPSKHLRGVVGPARLREQDRPRDRPGRTHPEDTALPTVIFQTTLNKLRDILAATGRNPREDNSIGIMAAINEVTESRRVRTAPGRRTAQPAARPTRPDRRHRSCRAHHRVRLPSMPPAVCSRPLRNWSTPSIRPSCPCRCWPNNARS